jgi:hypothetical protein
MSQFLREVLHAVQVALTFIGGGTVLGFIGWLYKRRQENFEDKVLVMFQNSQNQQLRTAAGTETGVKQPSTADVR